jgi:hypothetical protein
MSIYTKAILIFLVGGAVGAGLTIHFRQSVEPPDPALGIVPDNRESQLVFKWALENHPSGRELRFVRWESPQKVSDNPITNEPATRVRVVVQSNRPLPDQPAPLELYEVFVKDNEVIGAARKENLPPSAAPKTTTRPAAAAPEGPATEPAGGVPAPPFPMPRANPAPVSD